MYSSVGAHQRSRELFYSGCRAIGSSWSQSCVRIFVSCGCLAGWGDLRAFIKKEHQEDSLIIDINIGIN
jgi:hypothetical protein